MDVVVAAVLFGLVRAFITLALKCFSTFFEVRREDIPEARGCRMFRVVCVDGSVDEHVLPLVDREFGSLLRRVCESVFTEVETEDPSTDALPELLLDFIFVELWALAPLPWLAG